MAIRKLVFTRSNEETEIVFDKQLNVLTDAKLSKELGTENIKNEDSPLIIKSMNNTQIADVIQIKINLSSTGVFLVNFGKEDLNEENRKKLISSLSELKVKEELTKETQVRKAKKILEIIDSFNPIYVTFVNSGSIKIDISPISKNTRWSYPLLLLMEEKKEPSIFDKLAQTKLFQKKYVKFEYLFITLFALLNGFATICGIHELLNSNNAGIFMIVLSVLFAFIIAYISYQITIKENKEKDKNLKFVLLIYSFIGSVIGVLFGLLIAKLLLVSEEQIFDVQKCLLFSFPSSLILSLGFVFLSKPLDLLIKLVKKEK